MCGIYGYYGSGDKELLLRMGRVIKHRGPDDHGTHVGTNIGLGSERLSIVGLKTGKQPIYNENKDIVVVANCEIYNFRDLRAGLEKKGHRFYTDCDTEVIVHLYEEYGLDAPKYMNGDFAFAIWDDKKKRLILGRDHFGINPLYYAIDGPSIYFASEIKAILESAIHKELDLEGLNDYLTFTYNTGKNTLLKQIYKILPGTVLEIVNGQIAEKTYWTIPSYDGIERTESELIANVKHAVMKGVQNRMMADVPLGISLSDGVDSNIVAGIASQYTREPIHSYSLSMPGVDTSRIKIAVERFGFKHTEISLESDHFRLLPKIAWHADALNGDPTLLPTYLISQAAHGQVKTLLTGEGSDETFYGYTLFKLFGDSQHEIHNRPEKKYYRFISLMRDDFTPGEKKLLLSKKLNENSYDILKPYFNNSQNSYDQISRILLNNFLAHGLLNKLNCMSLANSVEGRVPFLDMETISVSLQQVPSHLKIRDGTEKWILRKAFSDMIPPEIIGASKKPFAVPIEEIFGDQIRSDIINIFEDTQLFKDYFDKNYVLALIEKNKKNRAYSRQLWSLLMFGYWYKNFLKKA
jgi:asparagine synthase (glutamine-hydrolysing)